MKQVQLYDTTLRDGMQGQGMSLSVEEKIRVVHALDDLGVAFIEAGFPGSNPKEVELFTRLEQESLNHAVITSFGMTRRRGVNASEDETLRLLAETFAPATTLVGKTWDLHLEKVTKVSREENLEMIAESVAFMDEAGKRVIYDAEHFFDGFASDRDYAIECVRTAVEAGAECVTLCDTNGASLPASVAEATAAVVEAVAGKVTVGIHTHNDAECAVADSLAAVDAGARLVQGTINGIGERTGNANLTSILPALQLKMGYDVVSPAQLENLTPTAHFIDELLNRSPDPDQPYVGKNAFAHKGGMHVAGVRADARTFEHVEPTSVGNRREALVSELSGKGTVLEAAEEASIAMSEEQASHALRSLKEKEHRGYQYEAADGSFELLLRRETERYESLFKVESFRVLVESREGGGVTTQATIKLSVDGESSLMTAEGNGPVNALDNALRAALVDKYPELASVELTNYKVRILDEHQGTGAVTRVLLDSTDGTSEWGSIGVSENIIEASWEALLESLDYALQKRRAG